jgi:hypothetical protein
MIMKAVNRRFMLFWSALAGIGASRVAEAAPKKIGLGQFKKEAEINALYHCDFGDPGRFGQMLTNINNFLSVYEFDPFKVKAVIVTHGPGVKYFLTDLVGTPWEKETLDSEITARIEALAKYGVEVYICQITFKRLKIDLAKIREAPYVRLVDSGVASVAELQTKGYAYVKVG